MTRIPGSTGTAAAVAPPRSRLADALRETAAHTVVYGLGNLLVKLTEIVLIPVYTHLLSPADYGVLSIALVWTSLASTVAGLGLGNALFRSYYDYTDQENRSRVVTTALVLAVISGAVLVAVASAAGPSLASALFGDAAKGSYVMFLAGIAACDVLQGMPLAVYRARKMSLTYSILNGILLFVRLGVIIWLVAIARLGVYGVLLGMLIGNAVTATVLLAGVIRTIEPRFSREEAAKLVSYGAPLVLVSLAVLLVSTLDRLSLRYYMGFGEVGVYNLAYQIGAAVSVLLVVPFKLVWPAMMCSMESEPHAQAYFARTLTYFMFFGLMVALAIALPAREIVAIFAPPEYGRASHIVPIISTSYLMLGVWSITNTGMALKRKTLEGVWASVAAVAVSLASNMILVPRFGGVGAAEATLVSYVTLCAASFWLSQRHYAVNHEWGRLARMLAAAAVVFLAGRAIETPYIWLSVLLKLAAVACFPLLLVPFGFYSGELKYARQAIRHWVHGSA